MRVETFTPSNGRGNFVGKSTLRLIRGVDDNKGDEGDMPPRREEGLAAQVLTRLGEIQTDVREVSRSLASLTARVEGIEARQEGSDTTMKDGLARVERDVTRLDADLRSFKEKMTEREREEAERDREEAKEAGEERGVNKTNWKVVAAIGAVALAVLGDLVFHFATASSSPSRGEAAQMSPLGPLNYTPTEPSKLHTGEK